MTSSSNDYVPCGVLASFFCRSLVCHAPLVVGLLIGDIPAAGSGSVRVPRFVHARPPEPVGGQWAGAGGGCIAVAPYALWRALALGHASSYKWRLAVVSRSLPACACGLPHSIGSGGCVGWPVGWHPMKGRVGVQRSEPRSSVLARK